MNQDLETILANDATGHIKREIIALFRGEIERLQQSLAKGLDLQAGISCRKHLAALETGCQVMEKIWDGHHPSATFQGEI